MHASIGMICRFLHILKVTPWLVVPQQSILGNSLPVKPEEGVSNPLQLVPLKPGHLGIMPIPVVVAVASLSILITCTQTSTLVSPAPASGATSNGPETTCEMLHQGSYAMHKGVPVI